MLNAHGTSNGGNKRISSGHEIHVKICYISKKIDLTSSGQKPTCHYS